MTRTAFIATGCASVGVICAALVWVALRSPDAGGVATMGSSSPAPLREQPAAAGTPETSPAPGPAATASPGVQPWEMQIDEVLRSNLSELEAAQILISTLPTLPEDGQVEAAQHIANLLSDKDYNRLMPILLNPHMPESVLSVFVTDLMNRSDETKLPALLDIAKVPDHPFHEEALSDLQIYLNEDYGVDWAKWKAALDQYLAEQAAAAASATP